MLSILNHSIDFDYLLVGTTSIANSVVYDDIDSFTEYFIEKILGDDNYTSEQDDDSGAPENKCFEKDYTSMALYYNVIKITPQVPIAIAIMTWPKGLDLSNRTCKGFFNVFSPPPDMA